MYVYLNICIYICMNIYIYRYLLYTSCLSNFFANTQSSQALPTYTLQASLDHFKSNFSSNYTYIKFKLCFQNVSDNLISVIQPPREVVICVSGADARRGSPGAQVKGDGSLEISKWNWWSIDIETCKGVLICCIWHMLGIKRYSWK